MATWIDELMDAFGLIAALPDICIGRVMDSKVHTKKHSLMSRMINSEVNKSRDTHGYSNFVFTSCWLFLVLVNLLHICKFEGAFSM